MNEDDLPTISISSIADTLDLGTVNISSMGSGYGYSGSNGTSASDWLNTSIVGAQGSASNAIWTTSTSGIGVTWAQPSTPMTVNQNGKIELKGEHADLEINGRSMSEWMKKVEERLNILTPNPELEAEWDELRRLGERYRKLEKKCKEKAEVWKKLKQMPPPKLD